MPPPLPRRNRSVLASLASRPLAAFPASVTGRLPHHSFRGLLSVHFALRPAWSLSRPRRPFVIGVLRPMSLPPSSAPTATGWSDSCRAGFAPAEEWRLVTAHTDLMLTSRGPKTPGYRPASSPRSRLVRPRPRGLSRGRTLPAAPMSRASRSTSRRWQGPVGGHQGHRRPRAVRRARRGGRGRPGRRGRRRGPDRARGTLGCGAAGRAAPSRAACTTDQVLTGASHPSRSEGPPRPAARTTAARQGLDEVKSPPGAVRESATRGEPEPRRIRPPR